MENAFYLQEVVEISRLALASSIRATKEPALPTPADLLFCVALTATLSSFPAWERVQG